MRARSAGREYALVLAAGAAGAALVLLSARQGWAQVLTPAQGPLPATSLPVTGQDLVPAAAAVALAALAGLAGVIATRGRARRFMGVVLAAFGVAIAVAVSVHLTTSAVLAAAHAAPVSQAGSAIAGGGTTSAGAIPSGLPGVSTAGQVVAANIPWRGVALLGALIVIAAGAAVAWRGGVWPAMSSRYDAPGTPQPERGTDSAGLWESLSMGEDPTDQARAAGPGQRE